MCPGVCLEITSNSGPSEKEITYAPLPIIAVLTSKNRIITSQLNKVTIPKVSFIIEGTCTPMILQQKSQTLFVI